MQPLTPLEVAQASAKPPGECVFSSCRNPGTERSVKDAIAGEELAGTPDITIKAVLCDEHLGAFDALLADVRAQHQAKGGWQ